MFAPQLAKKHAKIRSRINRKIAMLPAISYLLDYLVYYY
jgi:hypothetical protein